VKDFFATIGRGDREGLLALVAEDIEWIIPGKDWPLAGTHCGRAELTKFLETASRTIETSTEPREFVAQGDRVLVVGYAYSPTSSGPRAGSSASCLRRLPISRTIRSA
jgi:ketosteroid isomerase-like protein